MDLEFYYAYCYGNPLPVIVSLDETISRLNELGYELTPELRDIPGYWDIRKDSKNFRLDSE